MCIELRQYRPFVELGKAPFISVVLRQFTSDENQAFVSLHLLEIDLY